MLEMNVKQIQGYEHINVLALQGELDASSYQQLVVKAMELCQSEDRGLLLDLGNLHFMSSAGMAALHSIVRFLRGEPLHDMQTGWNVFHNIEQDIKIGTPSTLKICNLQPNVFKSLELSGINRLMEIYPDLQSALMSVPM